MDLFEKILFELNEVLHNVDILNVDYNITGTHLFISIITTVLLIIGYEKIVVGSKVYNKYKKYIASAPMVMIGTLGIIMIVAGIFFQQYGTVLFFIVFIIAELAIVKLDRFKNLRVFLDKKFGWMF